MVKCHNQLKEWQAEGFDVYLIMQVHDELVFDFPRGKGSRPWLTNLEKVRHLAALMAEGGTNIGVPTPVGIEYNGNNWSEGVTL